VTFHNSGSKKETQKKAGSLDFHKSHSPRLCNGGIHTAIILVSLHHDGCSSIYCAQKVVLKNKQANG
jgi:hypothetical protein